MVFVYSWSTLLWYRCYYPHRSKDSMSPVHGIFFDYFYIFWWSHSMEGLLSTGPTLSYLETRQVAQLEKDPHQWNFTIWKSSLIGDQPLYFWTFKPIILFKINLRFRMCYKKRKFEFIVVKLFPSTTLFFYSCWERMS